MATNVPKRRLANTTMFVNFVRKNYWKKRYLFTWNVPDFHKLKEKITYTNRVQSAGWVLKLTKKRFSVKVIIDSKRTGVGLRMSCCVCYDYLCPAGCSSPCFDLQQISADRHEVTFPARAVNSPENWLLKEHGCLRLQFVFCERTMEGLRVSRCDRDYSWMLELKSVSPPLNQCLPDFSISPLSGPKIMCHRAFLAARSLFFHEFFRQTNGVASDMQVCTTSEILEIVVRYIYSGFYESKNITKLEGIIRLAWSLNIPCLQTLCRKFTSSFVNFDNVHRVKELGIEMGLSFLVEEAEELLAKMDTFI